MIEVKKLSKSYDNLLVLDEVDLKIEKGDVVAVLGPSGSGKTTLLRCLNFLEKADQGTLIFDDEQIDLCNVSKSKMQKIRKKTAFVFQNFNLFLNKTVLQNVTEGLIVARHMDKQEAIEIGKRMLDKVGLAEKYDSYPNQLSGGQQQRVGIARALATNPEIIYFDEPTSALDPELIKEVLNVIKSLAEEKMTMLIVTHEMNFASKVSNKVIFMDNSKILYAGQTKKFFENPGNKRIEEFLHKIK